MSDELASEVSELLEQVSRIRSERNRYAHAVFILDPTQSATEQWLLKSNRDPDVPPLTKASAEELIARSHRLSQQAETLSYRVAEAASAQRSDRRSERESGERNRRPQRKEPAGMTERQGASSDRYFAAEGTMAFRLIEVLPTYFEECLISNTGAFRIERADGHSDYISGTRYLVLEDGSGVIRLEEESSGAIEVIYLGEVLRRYEPDTWLHWEPLPPGTTDDDAQPNSPGEPGEPDH